MRPPLLETGPAADRDTQHCFLGCGNRCHLFGAASHQLFRGRLKTEREPACPDLFNPVLTLSADDLLPFNQGSQRILYGSLSGFIALEV